MRLPFFCAAFSLMMLALPARSRAQSTNTITLQEGVNGYQHGGAFIRGDNVTQNAGARDQILVGKTSAPMRAVFSFGLSSIPAGSAISSVTFSVWTDPLSSTALGIVGTLELHQLTGTPVEGTGTTTGGAGTGVTWASRDGQTGTGHLWTTAGGDYDATVLSSVPGFNTLTPNVQKSFASTSALVAAVQAAVDQGKPLDLLISSPTTEAGANNIYTRLCSDDSTTTSQRPLLSVTFTPPDFPPPTSLSAVTTAWSQAALNWSLYSSNATGVVIERQTAASGVWTPVIIAAPETTRVMDTGLSASTSYTWRIKAQYASGDSAYTTSNTLTTPAAVTSPSLVIMPLGDSITEGTLSGGYRSPLYATFSAAGYTIRYIGSQTISSTQILTDSENQHHEGHAGYTIQQIIDNLDGGTSNGGHWMDGISGTRDPAYPEVILLMIGTNDLGVQQRTVAATLASYDKLLTKLYTLHPSALVLASTLIPYTGTTYPDREQHQLEFNAALPDLIATHRAAGQQIWLYDMRTKVLPEHISSDGVHPNQAGYNALASGWFEGFSTLPLIENWRRARFNTAANSGAAANLSDPDGDGLNNLGEYAFGTDPNNPSSGFQPDTEVVTDSAGAAHLQISFSRRIGSELIYHVQTSADLAASPAWQEGGVLIGAPVALDEQYEHVTYRDVTSLSTASKRFMRIQVELP